jgi:hypothetical protein
VLVIEGKEAECCACKIVLLTSRSCHFDDGDTFPADRSLVKESLLCRCVCAPHTAVCTTVLRQRTSNAECSPFDGILVLGTAYPELLTDPCWCQTQMQICEDGKAVGWSGEELLILSRLATGLCLSCSWRTRTTMKTKRVSNLEKKTRCCQTVQVNTVWKQPDSGS